MMQGIKGLPVWRLLCAAAFLCVASAVSAAEPEKGSTPPAEDGANASKSGAGARGKAESEPSGSKTSEPEAGAGDDADKAKDSDEKSPDAEKPPEGEGPSPGEKASNQGPQDADRKGAARLKDLIADGFLIRTTVFVPADAVTRQTGKISSDAMVLTLQKETVIAICYYTLRAYVNGRKGLTKIPSCMVYQ